jgi:hypothetical protein
MGDVLSYDLSQPSLGGRQREVIMTGLESNEADTIISRHLLVRGL